MDDHARHAVEGEEDTDAGRVKAETAREFEGWLEVRVGRGVRLARVVHEDWDEAVEGDVVSCEKCVADQIEDGLAGEAFGDAGRGFDWLLRLEVGGRLNVVRGFGSARLEETFTFRGVAG